jgi:hypothetical protein
MAVPTMTALVLPTMAALRQLGGSGRNAEIRGAVADAPGLTEEDQRIPPPPLLRRSQSAAEVACAARLIHTYAIIKLAEGQSIEHVEHRRAIHF